MTPWGQFPDPDTFYHAHLSALMLDHGPLFAFPWLDLTSFGQQFADHHYLFHLILGPAIWAFGEQWGTQLMAPLLALLTISALWTVLRVLNPSETWRRTSWVFVGLTLLAPDFLMRLLLGKASPLAIGYAIVTVGGMLHRKSILLLMTGMLFALSHGGWSLSILIAGSMLVADILASKTMAEASWIKALHNAPWKPLGALILGTGIGILLHPNSATLLQFLWVQLVEIGILTKSGTLTLGQEWAAASPSMILTNLTPLVVAGLTALLGILFAHRADARPTLVGMYQRALVLLFPVGLLLVLTLKSQRFIEFLVPLFAIWIYQIAQLVDWTKYRLWLREQWSRCKRTPRHTLTVAGGLIVLLLPLHHGWLAWKGLHTGQRPFDLYAPVMQTISERANPGDRVFHSSWDDFPVLWALEDRVKYLSGLDPTFLYHADPELSNQVMQLTLDSDPPDAWGV
ncbi:hypothetical protein GF380_05625, partial [Candidatus Uhrbacteria bacterium]|nr:hypothetical protein [Candidatus Uhrbacteria bacterium]MBD3284672.1 hypothetical protein [Candidatus Uhrbacteria bacterium]